MQAISGKVLLVLLAVTTVAACSRNTEPRLLNIRASAEGPDEFLILPNKPLQQPEDFAALPEPTPGGANLVDPRPNEDAIAALGGNPAVVSRGGVPSAEADLVNYASRLGRTSGIRQQLAAEDLDFRRRKDGRVLERLFNVNVYFRAYRPQALDQYKELERFRKLGVRTPAAPPDIAENR